MVGPPLAPTPQPPAAMCAAHSRALLTRFECTASGGRPCEARKLLMPPTSAPAAPLGTTTATATGGGGGGAVWGGYVAGGRVGGVVGGPGGGASVGVQGSCRMGGGR